MIENEYLSFLKHELNNVFGYSRERVCFSFAPGRVNLIGEHTDYHEGFVFPVAVNLRTFVAGRLRRDDLVCACSVNNRQKIEFRLSELAPPGQSLWWTYALGPIYVLREEKIHLDGMEFVIYGEVPQGGGLSSSAALEVAVLLFVNSLFNLSLPPDKVAYLARRAENEFAGVPCGIMDQWAAVFGREGHALFIDCRGMETEFVPVPGRWSIVVCDSGVRHSLASSEYAKRQEECRECLLAVRRKHPHVKALLDVTEEMLEEVRGEISEVAYRRCSYVLEENRRVLEAKEALRTGNREKVRELFGGSHEGLRYKYEVSCSELDVLVEIAGSIPGVVGARMTGGGFGGNTVNLVEKGMEEEFGRIICQEYKKHTGKEVKVRVLEAGEGGRAWQE